MKANECAVQMNVFCAKNKQKRIEMRQLQYQNSGEQNDKNITEILSVYIRKWSLMKSQDAWLPQDYDCYNAIFILNIDIKLNKIKFLLLWKAFTEKFAFA